MAISRTMVKSQPLTRNLLVQTCRRLVYRELPSLIKQRYGKDFRSKSLASLKPEISQALDSLLEEISNNADANILRSTASKFRQPPSRSPNYNSSRKPGTKPQVKSCPWCKQAGRSDRHFLSQCTHLPAEDRAFLAKARLASSLDDEDDPTDSVFFCPPETEDVASPLHPSARIVSCRVSTKQSPHFNAFYRHHPLKLPLETVRIFKNTTERRTVRRHEHLCQAPHTAAVVLTTPPNGSHPSPPHPDGSNPPQSFFFLGCRQS